MSDGLSNWKTSTDECCPVQQSPVLKGTITRSTIQAWGGCVKKRLRNPTGHAMTLQEAGFRGTRWMSVGKNTVHSFPVGGNLRITLCLKHRIQ